MSVRQSELIIDLNCIEHNLKSLQKMLISGSKIMPVIKANAYGLGAQKVLEVICRLDIKQVAVAIVDEGIKVRKLGYTGMIFILNQPFIEEIPAIIEYNLTPGIGSTYFVEEFGKYISSPHLVHIEVGTGMGRTGIRPDRMKEFIDKIKEYEKIKIEGIYTHFSSSDCDYEYTKKQISNFNFALDIAKNELGEIPYIHASNSAGIVYFPESHYTLVRPGIMIYGYLPDESIKGKIDLKPSVVLKSKIAYLKKLNPNSSIGYGRSFITSRDSIIATIPIGYADGVRRLLSNNGFVIINGKKAPIVGRVCMDSFMVDVTDIGNVENNNDVYIWDNNLITLEDVATRCETINYEILCTISDRVPRIYI